MNELNVTNPLFVRQFQYFNNKHQSKQSGSDFPAKLTMSGKVAEVCAQPLEDNLIQRFLTASTDQKLKEKILEIKSVNVKIPLNNLREMIKKYESNLTITGVNKLQANALKKVESKEVSRANSAARGPCWICGSKEHFKHQCTKKCQHCPSKGHRHLDCFS